MENYVYKRTRDGVHYLDLAKTWEKLMIAARIIGAIQSKNPKDVLVSEFFSNAPNHFWFIWVSILQIQLGRVQSPICPESYP